MVTQGTYGSLANPPFQRNLIRVVVVVVVVVAVVVAAG
jgi:hypothetical protein